jgi:RNA polymerase sigma-70 factor, ECF subfamily
MYFAHTDTPLPDPDTVLVVAHRSEYMYPSGKQERRPRLEFFSFNGEYVRRLAEGDPDVERHFIDYFSGLLLVKLRYRLQSDQEVEDLRQEVFLRVLCALREGAGVHQPERLGAYVYAVCNNVVLEHLRTKRRADQFSEEMPEPHQPNADLERDMVSEQSVQQVRALISELPAKDQNILRAVFLDERDKDAVCREFGVGRDYLRVLLHRAKNRLSKLVKDSASSGYHNKQSSASHS